MEEYCCICFPIDSGIKVLAALSIIASIYSIFMSLYVQGIWEIYWPMIVPTVIMGLVWVIALVNKDSRNFAAISFILLLCCLERFGYVWRIADGSIMETICTEQTVTIAGTS